MCFTEPDVGFPSWSMLSSVKVAEVQGVRGRDDTGEILILVRKSKTGKVG